MIRVLIAEDSPVTCHFIQGLFAHDPEMEVVGCARNGREAVDMASRLKPDVITMDVAMPKLDGYEATRQIMESQPVPVVICSAGISEEAVSGSYHALEAGAVAALRTPCGGQDVEAVQSRAHFIRMVKSMARVKLVRRWTQNKYAVAPPVDKGHRLSAAPPSQPKDSTLQYVVIGASTGGPIVLQTLLRALPREFPIPILIVQHMAQGFVQGFRRWLASITPLSVDVAEDGMRPEAGHVYLAPDNLHMGLDGKGIIRLWDHAPVHHLKPAIAPLFDSMVRHFPRQTLGVILTGMGRDGAAQMCALRERGGMTIVQDAESSVVNGMPGETVRLGGAQYIEPADRIASRICHLLHAPIDECCYAN